MNISKKFMKTIITSSILFSSLSYAQPATDNTIKKLNSYFEQCHLAEQCNGSFIVAEKGKILYHQALGFANHEDDQQLSITDQFDIGSISKQFTAIAVIILEEQGKLDLDIDIRQYLPELPYQGMTIRHLLTHTSGAPDVMAYLTGLYRAGKVKAAITNDTVIAALAKEKIPVLALPGHEWKYSNTGYVLLASIVAKVSKQPFSEFLEDHIFTPLSMNDSVIRSSAKAGELNNRIYGFLTNIDGSRKAYDQIPFFDLTGLGGIYSTTGDLYKWDIALQQSKLISNENWVQATTPVTLINGKSHPYGFGLDLDPIISGRERIGHGGHWRGFKAQYAHLPKNEQTIILLTNSGLDDSVDESIDAISAILAGEQHQVAKANIGRTLYPIFINQGAASAKKFYLDAKNKTPDNYEFSEQELNNLGYFLKKVGKKKEALVAFELNHEAFPESINAIDSLVETLLELDQKHEAISQLKLAMKKFKDSKVLKGWFTKLDI